jgi:hypothetical protein
VYDNEALLSAAAHILRELAEHDYDDLRRRLTRQALANVETVLAQLAKERKSA